MESSKCYAVSEEGRVLNEECQGKARMEDLEQSALAKPGPGTRADSRLFWNVVRSESARHGTARPSVLLIGGADLIVTLAASERIGKVVVSLFVHCC